MDQTFCIDYSQLTKREKKIDVEAEHISELVHRNRMKNGIATIFHSERISLTFSSLKVESDQLASSFLSTGLSPGDRILLIGSNESLLLLSILACARSKLIFCLVSPHFNDSESLVRIMNQGAFKAVCIFNSNAEIIYRLLKAASPDIARSERGAVKSTAMPSLTHIFIANEEHLHAGVYTMSSLMETKTDLSLLPSLDSFSTHSMAALVQSMGSTGVTRLAAVSHFQLLGGARSVNHAFGLSEGVRWESLHQSIQSLHQDSVCVCLPLHRGALLPLLCLSPFLSHCTLVFPAAEPLPASVFQCITYYNLSVLLSNGAALRLLLKIYERRQTALRSLLKVLLIGERVSPELRSQIRACSPSTQLIAVGYVLSETASIPIMADESININKLVGRTITGFSCSIKEIKGGRPGMGRLFITPFQPSTFLGYAPTFDQSELIDTGDVAEVDEEGNIHIVCPISDLVYDQKGFIFNHKPLEKILALSHLIKGSQIIARPPSSFVACCVPKKMPFDPHFLKAELSLLCRETGMRIPPFWAFLPDFPRTKTRVQKFKLRELLSEGKLELI
ncbi:hypothetical protein PMAYCL1PPCAC_23823 [Pristionchus mayeri]|uniref:AMP-dependent synthetase/ligase domain-containing protein n=1 Tax=Pristionchus mayeri TaxID=1317129 RepID=A0AAN5CZ40_9BILA|nr:hypothetical protein PMAYCL1PPCAC_23823 [Pristionchus mayeri]